MTRINCIPVEQLTDNFLMAEYFELPRLYPLIAKAIFRKDTNIPETYRMGSGHMRFFYNKLKWLRKRHKELEEEGLARYLTLQVDPDVDPAYLCEWAFLVPPEYNQDWEPKKRDLEINRNRLEYRRRYDGGIYQGSR